jgi:hypothetical protein
MWGPVWLGGLAGRHYELLAAVTLAVRDCQAIADSGGSFALAFEDGVEGGVTIDQGIRLGEQVDQLRDNTMLLGGRDRYTQTIERYELRQFHNQCPCVLCRIPIYIARPPRTPHDCPRNHTCNHARQSEPEMGAKDDPLGRGLPTAPGRPRVPVAVLAADIHCLGASARSTT